MVLVKYAKAVVKQRAILHSRLQRNRTRIKFYCGNGSVLFFYTFIKINIISVYIYIYIYIYIDRLIGLEVSMSDY